MRRTVEGMTYLVVALVVVALLAIAVARRGRRDAHDLREAQHTAGSFGLGEAPPFPHHRLGSAGQRRRP